MATIVVPSAISTLSIGGRVFSDVTNNLITLWGNLGGAANGNTTLRNQRTTTAAGYQVTAGKTLQLFAMRFVFSTAGTITMCYADADVGLSTNTAFTNGTFPGGSNTNNLSIGSIAVGVWTEVPLRFDVPATKYPCITNNAGVANAAVQFFGYEV